MNIDIVRGIWEFVDTAGTVGFFCLLFWTIIKPKPGLIAGEMHREIVRDLIQDRNLYREIALRAVTTARSATALAVETSTQASEQVASHAAQAPPAPPQE